MKHILEREEYFVFQGGSILLCKSSEQLEKKNNLCFLKCASTKCIQMTKIRIWNRSKRSLNSESSPLFLGGGELAGLDLETENNSFTFLQLISMCYDTFLIQVATWSAYHIWYISDIYWDAGCCCLSECSLLLFCLTEGH